MIFGRYIPVFLLAYICQTTLLAALPLRPELLLIVFCLFFSGRRSAALLGGFFTGLALDIFNGVSLYNSVLYTLTGSLCGFMPVSIFRDFRSLALVNLCFGSLILNLGYAVLSGLFLRKFIFLPLLLYPVLLLLDVLCFWLLHRIFWRPHD